MPPLPPHEAPSAVAELCPLDCADRGAAFHWHGPDDLRPHLVPIASLTVFHRNPRRGDLGVIADSLAVHGQYRPITANRGTGTGRPDEVLAGNHTMVAAADRLGWTHIAATFVDVTELLADKIVLADNRAADLGRYEDADLAALLQSVAEAEAGNLSGTGYEVEDLEDLLDLIAFRENAPQDPAGYSGATTAARADGAAADPAFKGRADRYADKGTRPIILDYALDEYEAVVAMLEMARGRADVETNAAAVRAALEMFTS